MAVLKEAEFGIRWENFGPREGSNNSPIMLLSNRQHTHTHSVLSAALWQGLSPLTIRNIESSGPVLTVTTFHICGTHSEYHLCGGPFQISTYFSL